jgi:hypothetical protein
VEAVLRQGSWRLRAAAGLVEAVVGLATIWRITRGWGVPGAAGGRDLSREGSMVLAILVKI